MKQSPTRATGQYGNPPVPKIPTETNEFRMKLIAEFRTGATTATFYPNLAMKGLQGEIFDLGHQMEVISLTGDRQYSLVDNFPNKKEDFDLYHIIQQSQVRTNRQSRITVEFNMKSNVSFSKIKVGHLMGYLTQNKVWLQEKCFNTPNLVPIGFMTLHRHDFINAI